MVNIRFIISREDGCLIIRTKYHSYYLTNFLRVYNHCNINYKIEYMKRSSLQNMLRKKTYDESNLPYVFIKSRTIKIVWNV